MTGYDSSLISVTGENALSFSVQGDWGHFRRIEATTTKPTYRIIPRTTAIGLIAAILGLERDSYYDDFAPENAGIAIEPVNPIRTRRLPVQEVTLESGDSFESMTDNALPSIKAGLDNRQQRLYEYVRNPKYRISIVLDNNKLYQSLKAHLEGHPTSVYTPALGKAHCLASIEYHGEFEVEESDEGSVTSIVPTEFVRGNMDVSLERTQYHFQRKTHSRQPTGFISYAFDQDAEPVQVTENAPCTKLNDRSVIFV